MNRITRLLLLCVFALVGTSAGPVGAASPYGWVRPDGRPVVWNNSQPISYSVDQGPLGRLSNADAAALVQTAFPALARRQHRVDQLYSGRAAPAGHHRRQCDGLPQQLPAG